MPRPVVRLSLTRCSPVAASGRDVCHAPSAGRLRKGMSPFSCRPSVCGKGCRPWEVLGCRGFLQARKNLRPPGPRPVHALLRKPRDRPPALVRRGSPSHGATPFPLSPWLTSEWEEYRLFSCPLPMNHDRLGKESLHIVSTHLCDCTESNEYPPSEHKPSVLTESRTFSRMMVRDYQFLFIFAVSGNGC